MKLQSLIRHVGPINTQRARKPSAVALVRKASNYELRNRLRAEEVVERILRVDSVGRGGQRICDRPQEGASPEVVSLLLYRWSLHRGKDPPRLINAERLPIGRAPKVPYVRQNSGRIDQFHRSIPFRDQRLRK